MPKAVKFVSAKVAGLKSHSALQSKWTFASSPKSLIIFKLSLDSVICSKMTDAVPEYFDFECLNLLLWSSSDLLVFHC